MKKHVLEKITTLVIAAFGLVAALAWNEAIKAMFKQVFGTSETFLGMIVYAVLVTTIAVIVAIYLGKKQDEK
jgi:hypothetical protein